ncbi:proteasome-associated ATPase-like [Culex quinquefasciatus]|uniref:proteasome-associated ATPase-like n=1 Tax=Culex quinquefasciatus TaxID=7176 RepID=UPI0018E2F5F0|nr:proteasome-associated ATPase-like [Culex quinquefasciatus]XP_038106578.1 proteasome-associated ATPase-like [Culex quinquefasciatus]XP_038106614.1 proteasome-associated ATPase-like [Culex quinquefasciatus]XP_038106653.1 proteasome-associated ATPase-like [Culex quinquefasciatus]XP_038109024.1 proteasome-associated ATPase-like [Culex quinquefasciatus]
MFRQERKSSATVTVLSRFALNSSGTGLPTSCSNIDSSRRELRRHAGHRSERSKHFKMEVLSKLVNTSFEDSVGIDKILSDVSELLLHVKHPEVYRHIGLPSPRGFLPHGPPGSGKSFQLVTSGTLSPIENDAVGNLDEVKQCGRQTVDNVRLVEVRMMNKSAAPLLFRDSDVE